MNLELLPPVFAILLSIAAFAVAWMVGLASDVPAHSIALRATAAAAVFWLVGLVAGKIFVNCVYAAIGEQMAQRQAKSQPAASARRPKA